MGIQIETNLPTVDIESAHTATRHIIDIINGSGYTIRHFTQSLFYVRGGRFEAGYFDIFITFNETEDLGNEEEAIRQDREVIKYLRRYLGSAWEIKVDK